MHCDHALARQVTTNAMYSYALWVKCFEELLRKRLGKQAKLLHIVMTTFTRNYGDSQPIKLGGQIDLESTQNFSFQESQVPSPIPARRQGCGDQRNLCAADITLLQGTPLCLCTSTMLVPYSTFVRH